MGKLENAYIAGLFDGEGSARLSISRSSGYCQIDTRVKISNTDLSVLEFVKAETGKGFIVSNQKYPGRNQNCKIGYIWTAARLSATHVATMILPYVRIKRDRLEILLRVQTIKDHLPRGTGATYTPEQMSELIRLRDELRALNKRGV